MNAIFGMPIGRRYSLLQKLGEGGMGEVYRAYDGLARQIVALKRVHISLDSAPDSEESTSHANSLRLALAQEFHTLASLRHPHIISVLDYGFDDERQPYFTMDYLENAAPLQDAHSQPLEYRLTLLVQVLQAVAYLHRRGIIHRDLKPANVQIVDGEARVLDFGLSVVRDRGEQTEQGVAGTLAYMAPEVLMGQPASQSADLYAVGLMAYELLVGRHPFHVEDVGQLINDILSTSPDLTPLIASDATTQPSIIPSIVSDSDMVVEFPEHIAPFAAEPISPLDDQAVETGSEMAPLAPSPSLTEIIARLLAKRPTERYPDAEAVITDLARATPYPLPTEGTAIRESYLQAASFVGRAQELKRLEEALEATENSTGSAWLIGGESGVGKTRLLDELRIRALVRGFQVLRGQAVADGGVPFQLWREPVRRMALGRELSDLDAGILRDVVPDMDLLQERMIPEVAPLQGIAHQQRLLGTLASLFQNQRQPTVLLLEDLQWSRESVDVLKLITGMAGELPLLILASYRDDERPDLPNLLPGAQAMRLARLNADEIGQLSASMLGASGQQTHILEFLERETEGNVFFLVEVVRALAEEAGSLDRVGRVSLPKSVAAGGIQGFVQRRLTRVPAEDTELLWLAAVIGRELDLGLLEHLKGVHDLEEWLVTCSNIAVVAIEDGIWRFAHDKLRTGALAMIPADTRPALHRRVAEAIEVVSAGAPEQAAILAQHWGSAQDRHKERVYAQAAGEYALQVSAFGHAMRHFERALELLDSTLQPAEDGRLIRAELELKLGEVRKYTGEYPAAVVHIERALAVRREQNDTLNIALALLELGDLTIYLGDYSRAKTLCEESLALYRGEAHESGIARALDRLGLVLFHQGDYTGAITLCEQALTISRAINDQKSIASTINNLGMAAFAQGDYPAATRYFEETLAITQASGERRRAAAALLNLGSAAGEQQDYIAANRRFEESLEIFRSIGERRGVALALDNLGVIAEFQKDFASATHFYEDSLALARSIGNKRGVATTLVNLGNVARAQDEDERAATLYRQGMRHAQEIEAVPLMLEALTGISALQTDPCRGLEWLGLVLNHTATFEGTRKVAEPIIADLTAQCPAPDVAQGCLDKGKTLELKAVVTEILAVADDPPLD